MVRGFLYKGIVFGTVILAAGSMPMNAKGDVSISPQSQAFLQGLMNMEHPQVQQVAAPAPTATTITEAEMGKMVGAFPPATGTAVFTQKKDGFDVNGRRYIDPEGTIVKYGFDSVSADVTYMAETGEDHFLLKYGRVNTDAESISIAAAERGRDGWKVSTQTGKTLRGDTLVPVSKGFLVNRKTTAFLYVPGKGTQSIALPDKYVVSTFQNGQVQQSRYLLIEKAPEENKGLFKKISALGSALGVSSKNDFAYFNIDTGGLIPINVSLDAKEVSEGQVCRKKNAFVNECARFDFVESLYQKNGLPNGGHYYWRTAWIHTPSGPILMWTDEGFGAKTILYNPTTKKKVVAFSRALGINYFNVKNLGNGRFSMSARLGFSEEKIDDIEKFFNEAPAVES